MLAIDTPHRQALAGLAILTILAGGYVAASGDSGPSQAELVEFAQCLTANNATFYGAYWCPHCNDQKAMFGAAMDHIDYVECSPNGRDAPQSQACQEQGITGYPTWIIQGEQYGGVQSYQDLASATGCPLP